MRPDRFRFRLAALALVAIAAVPGLAWAQRVRPIAAPVAAAEPAPDPADPFFDDNVLHDIKLTINARDWESLKINERHWGGCRTAYRL